MKTNIKRAVFTGDYMVSDTFVDDEIGIDINFRRWPEIVATELEFRYNNSAGGHITVDSVSSSYTNMIGQYSPSLIIMDGGIEDAMNTNIPVIDIASDIEFISITAFETSVDMVYIFFPVDFSSIGQRIYNTRYSDFRRQLLTLCTRYGIKCIDLSTTLGGVGNVKSSAYFPDKMHLNQNGQMLAARKISEELQKWFGTE